MPQRVDDCSITNDDWLWRRIRNRPEWFSRDTGRVSSVAFLDGIDGEVSVDQAKLTTLENALRLDPDDGLVQLQAIVPRSLSHSVVADPEDDNPAHALICPPDKLSFNQRKISARKMAQIAEWIEKPKSLRKQ